MGNQLQLRSQIRDDEAHHQQTYSVSGIFFPRASERRVLLIVGVCQTFSHIHIFTWHLQVFTSSHLHIFSSSHLHILTSSHSLLPSCSLALLLSCPLALSFFSISLLKARGSANETARNATLSHEMRFDRQNWGKIVISLVRAQPFRTKSGSIAKNWGKIVISLVRAQPFRTKWGSIAKNWSKMFDFTHSFATLLFCV